MKKTLLIQLVALLGFWLLFLGLQNPKIYRNSLGLVANNWQNQQGERKLVKAPYTQLNNNNYLQWDGEHYARIKAQGYQVEQAGGDYIFAFFPLFPILWKISLLPPVGMLFLNYLFFSLSILLLLKLLAGPGQYRLNALLSLSLPGLVIFLMPYTEATYMLLVSVGLYGFVKKRYWIYFAGLGLAALTRPSFSFLLLSIMGTEFFFVWRHQQVKMAVVNTLRRISPLLAGTAVVSLVQYAQGSGSWFKFIEVQKYWENVLTVPHQLRDWSHEGFGINIGVLFLLFVPLLVLLFQLFFRQLPTDGKASGLSYQSPRDYLLVLSLLYLIGNCLFVLLFRGGSLHCLFRFTICSPFFYCLLFLSFDYIRTIAANIRLFVFSTLALLSLLVLGLADYSTYWNFSDFGLFLLIDVLGAWLFQDWQNHRTYRVGLVLLLAANLLWTSYLFNTYISNGWIFA